MRKTTMGSIAATLLLAGLMSGCAGLGKPIESPRISLSSIQVLESKGLETAFLVHLRVMNPNDMDLDITGVDCDLAINGKPVQSIEQVRGVMSNQPKSVALLVQRDGEKLFVEVFAGYIFRKGKIFNIEISVERAKKDIKL